jgi:predicted nucleic acid-binding protein
VFNFFFADDAPDKRKDTLKLFVEIAAGKYVPFTSNAVLIELARAAEPKSSKMLALLEEYKIDILLAHADESRLAEIYVAEGIIPEKYATDALHIASTTVNDIDFIVSYNFKHIVKRKTMMMTESVNLREGYKRIGIFSPTEVIEDE